MFGINCQGKLVESGLILYPVLEHMVWLAQSLQHQAAIKSSNLSATPSIQVPIFINQAGRGVMESGGRLGFAKAWDLADGT